MLGCIQPMSSPMMKRMLGFACCCCCCCCCADAGAQAIATAANDDNRLSRNFCFAFMVSLLRCLLSPSLFLGRTNFIVGVGYTSHDEVMPRENVYNVSKVARRYWAWGQHWRRCSTQAHARERPLRSSSTGSGQPAQRRNKGSPVTEWTWVAIGSTL